MNGTNLQEIRNEDKIISGVSLFHLDFTHRASRKMYGEIRHTRIGNRQTALDARNLYAEENGKGGWRMGVCVFERDYHDYMECRLNLRRGFHLMLHATRCLQCRRDILAWPGLRRLIRRSEHAGAGRKAVRKAGLTEGVMIRIR